MARYPNKVEYIARVRGKHENVKMQGGTSACAVMSRFGEKLSTFVPTAGQKKNIKAGRGKVRIMTKQVEAAYYRCKR